MREGQGIIVIMVGVVLVIAGVNGTLGNVWHALTSRSATPSSGSAPSTSNLPSGTQPVASGQNSGIPQGVAGVPYQAVYQQQAGGNSYLVAAPGTPGSTVHL